MRRAAVLRALRADARAWWYHRQLRDMGAHHEAAKRERASIRSHADSIRQALANGGWLHMGRGGVTLHYARHARIEGLHGGSIEAAIAAGVPAIDTRGMAVGDLCALLRGPMMGFADDSFGSDPESGLSTRRWPVIWERYARYPGCVFHNWRPAVDSARRGLPAVAGVQGGLGV